MVGGDARREGEGQPAAALPPRGRGDEEPRARTPEARRPRPGRRAIGADGVRALTLAELFVGEDGESVTL